MIYIDDRKGSCDLCDVIPRHIPHTLCTLPFGDVYWMGNGVGDDQWPIGIEYKKINDLCNCIITGRLSGHQLLGMVNEYKRCYLLVEGIWRANPQDGLLEVRRFGKWSPLSLGSRRFMAREIMNYLTTLNIMCGVIPWITGGQQESGEWLVATYSWWQKKWDEHKSHKQFNECKPPQGAVKLVRPNLVHRVAKELEGVGWDKAEKISYMFKSIPELVAADEKELQQVPGIGKVLAKRIVEQLRGTKP